MAVTISTSLDGDIAERVTALAAAERCTSSDVVDAAVSVFAILPKGVRDALMEAQGDPDPAELRKLAREMEAVVARRRLDRAAAALAAETPHASADAGMSEIERLEAASGPRR